MYMGFTKKHISSKLDSHETLCIEAGFQLVGWRPPRLEA